MTGFTPHEYGEALQHLSEHVDIDYPPHGVPVRQMRRALHKKRAAIAVEPDRYSLIGKLTIQEKMRVEAAKSMWFDLSTVDIDLLNEDIQVGQLRPQLDELERQPPAPSMMFLRQFKSETSGVRTVQGELVSKGKDGRFHIGAHTFYDRKLRMWLLTPGQILSELLGAHKSFSTLVPFFTLYLHMMRVAELTETTHSIGTGKPMQESMNPPEGTTYKVVHLNEPRTERSEHLGGTHASPRKHWRRGHWRHLRNGDRIWIEGMNIGTDERGEVRHDYIVMPEIPRQE